MYRPERARVLISDFTCEPQILKNILIPIKQMLHDSQMKKTKISKVISVLQVLDQNITGLLPNMHFEKHKQVSRHGNYAILTKVPEFGIPLWLSW